MTQNNKLFCFGYGYSCDYIGYALQDAAKANPEETWEIIGTSRNEERAEILKSRGITAHIFDTKAPLIDPLYFMEGVTHLLISTPPDDQGDPAFMAHHQDILKLPSLKWVGYLSTTGVYGDRGGDSVDERSEVRPSSQRGSRRMRAEEQWLSLFKSHNLPVHIFRLSGIYGPGRSALDTVRAGIARRINKPGHAFGRVHVEDIANIVLTSMRNPKPGEIYNVIDDTPAPSHLVIEYACELLGRPPPPMVNFEDANLAPITRSFYSENRRVKNNKIKDDLGITIKYPSYKEGLKACLDAENYALSQIGGGDNPPSPFAIKAQNT